MNTYPVTDQQKAALTWVMIEFVDSACERLTNGGLAPEDRFNEMGDVDCLINLLETLDVDSGVVHELRCDFVHEDTRAEIEAAIEALNATPEARIPADPMAGLLPVVDSDIVTEATFYAYVASPKAALALAKAVFTDKVERIEEIVLGGQPAYLVVTEAAALAQIKADDDALIKQAKDLGYKMFWSMGHPYAALEATPTCDNISGKGWISAVAPSETIADAARAAILHSQRTA